MYSQFDGKLCKVPSRFDEEEELEIIGKIIHAGGPDKNIQLILDIFFEYGIYEEPTKGNISNIV